MKKILITGANGYLGKEITNGLFGIDYLLVIPPKEILNLVDYNNVKNYLQYKQFDAVIHCAIKGGMRDDVDTIQVYDDNIKMVDNLLAFRDKLGLFINIGSGAELNKNRDLVGGDDFDDNFHENDYYGKSKREIYKRLENLDNAINLRLFGCFSSTEDDSRFIMNSIKNYIYGKDINIYQDKLFDFIYIEDFIKIIDYCLCNYTSISEKIKFKSIDCCYNGKYYLSDIAYIINSLSKHRVNIIFKVDLIGNPYIGKFKDFPNLGFFGLKRGIDLTYKKLKEEL